MGDGMHSVEILFRSDSCSFLGWRWKDVGAGNSLEDLQSLFFSMFSADLAAMSNPTPTSQAAMSFDKKRTWGDSDFDASFTGSCFVEETLSSSSNSPYFFNEGYFYDHKFNFTSKKTKSAAYVLNPSSPEIGGKSIGSKSTAEIHRSTCFNTFHTNVHDRKPDSATF